MTIKPFDILRDHARAITPADAAPARALAAAVLACEDYVADLESEHGKLRVDNKYLKECADHWRARAEAVEGRGMSQAEWAAKRAAKVMDDARSGPITSFHPNRTEALIAAALIEATRRGRADDLSVDDRHEPNTEAEDLVAKPLTIVAHRFDWRATLQALASRAEAEGKPFLKDALEAIASALPEAPA